MPTLKLTIVASIYGKPYKPHKCVHNLSSIATATTNTSNFAPRRPPMCAPGWRITPCAPLAPPAHNNNNNNNNNNNYNYSSLLHYRNLGFFRGQKSFNYSSSSEEKGGVLGGESGGLVTDMGPDNKDVLWLGNNRSPTSTLPSLNNHNHHHNNRQKPSAPPSPQQQSAKLLTLPTILTIGRVAAVPILIGTFYMNSWWGTTATTSIFIAAAITDWLDGYIARKMKLGSAFGAFLDPVADKLMVAATLVLLCTRPPDIATFAHMPWLLTVPSIAIIGREITMSAVREWAASQNSKLSEAVAVNNLGKWKTASQMTALTILLAARDSSLSGSGFLVASGVTLLYISAGLAVWSLVVYMRKIWKVLLR